MKNLFLISLFAVTLVPFNNILGQNENSQRQITIVAPSRGENIKDITMNLCAICPSGNCVYCDVLPPGQSVFNNSRKSRVKIDKRKGYVFSVTYKDGTQKNFIVDASPRRKKKVKLNRLR